MKLLAFDTSSAACSVAILNGDKLEQYHQHAPMQHAQLILGMIKHLLDSCALSLSQLDGIAYGCGPGSFTGIRIATSVAQSLAYAHHKPLIPISSLAALAQTALMMKEWEHHFVALDARMNQIYWAYYETQHNRVELVGQEKLLQPDEIERVKTINVDKAYGVGDGWAKYPTQLAQQLGFQPVAIHSSLVPCASAIIELAKQPYEQGIYLPPVESFSSYLRN